MNFENYVKGPVVHDALADLLGEGIFTTDGAVWKQQRQVECVVAIVSFVCSCLTRHAPCAKASSHLFKKRLMTEATRVILAHARDVEAYFDETGSDANIDAQALFSSFTMDSFTEVAFGRVSTSLRQKEPFQQAFDDVTKAMMFRLVFPMWCDRKERESALVFP